MAGLEGPSAGSDPFGAEGSDSLVELALGPRRPNIFCIIHLSDFYLLSTYCGQALSLVLSE